MKRKKSSRRFALQKVEVLSVKDRFRPRTQVKIALALGEDTFTGRAFVEPEDEDMLTAVSSATLDAIKSALPKGVEFKLKRAAKLKPQFLNEPLLVVLLDCQYEDVMLELTGACVSTDDRLMVGIASATLDATNRVVGLLLDPR